MPDLSQVFFTHGQTWAYQAFSMCTMHLCATRLSDLYSCLYAQPHAQPGCECGKTGCWCTIAMQYLIHTTLQALQKYKQIHADFPTDMECLRYLVHICHEQGKSAVHYYTVRIFEKTPAEVSSGTYSALGLLLPRLCQASCLQTALSYDKEYFDCHNKSTCCLYDQQ